MTDSIKIEGLSKLRRELKALATELPKELNKVSRDAAEIVAVEARSIAPRRSGRLAGTIKAGGVASGSYVKAGGVPYAAPIHWGWKKHHIKPNPFLYHALDDRRDEVIAKFVEGVTALVDRSITPGTGE